MLSGRLQRAKRPMAVAAACLGLFLIAGCDERVQVTRDPDVRIVKLATWAWQPAGPEGNAKDARDTRPVVSRDAISRGESVVRDKDANSDIVRDRVKNAIAQTLNSKGLTPISDPAAADFLVDYHFAVQRHNVTVQTVHPGGYPGVVCGPFRCWDSWGWGPPEVGYERIRFREGTIVFDFLQRSSKHLVYRAIGQKPVKRDTFTLTQEEINGLVRHLLKDLRAGK